MTARCLKKPLRVFVFLLRNSIDQRNRAKNKWSTAQRSSLTSWWKTKQEWRYWTDYYIKGNGESEREGNLESDGRDKMLQAWT